MSLARRRTHTGACLTSTVALVRIYCRSSVDQRNALISKVQSSAYELSMMSICSPSSEQPNLDAHQRRR